MATNKPTSTSDSHGEALENDVCFILTSAFLIFTMQTGYGLLGLFVLLNIIIIIRNFSLYSYYRIWDCFS